MEPRRLLKGDLSALGETVACAIEGLARRQDVISVAKLLGIAPVLLVLGMLARVEAGRDRLAARFARKILGPRPCPEVEGLALHLGL